MLFSSDTARTYVTLRFIVVSTNSNRAPLHESHDPLKVSLVNNAPIVLEGFWIVCVKLLQCVKQKINDVQSVCNLRIKDN